MVKKWKVKIPTLSGDMDRRAYIYLPASYNQEPEKRYPVMYMFDGHNVFFGAGDEARTRYLHLGKVALYRMSYTRGTRDIIAQCF